MFTQMNAPDVVCKQACPEQIGIPYMLKDSNISTHKRAPQSSKVPSNSMSVPIHSSQSIYISKPHL